MTLRCVAALRRAVCCLALPAAAAAQSAAQPAAPPTPPAWAYPMGPGKPAPYDSVTPLGVPGSRARYTEAEIMARSVVADWLPGTHPPMPASVGRGRPPEVRACAYCHLPNGLGRPENAPLAGLPAAYIARQVADMRDGTRHAAWTGPPAWAESMHQIAQRATDAEVAEAAAYFARLRYTPHVRVVESAQVPVTRVAGTLYAKVADGGTEPLGTRLVEFARDHELHERHDVTSGYLAYVPPGSVARGARLATRGVDGPATACTTCHGPTLHGVGLVPPLAGRSPSYLLRQLLAFQSGARDTPAGQPMKPVVARMHVEDMIDAVAYAASRRP